MTTYRERILDVYQGRTPDRVPFMLDLSHWYLHKNHLPWDLSARTKAVGDGLVEYHKKNEIGFYLPTNSSFYSVQYPTDINVTVAKEDDGKKIVWTLDTPIGKISRSRIWHETTYSWAIGNWGVRNEQDLLALGHALGGRTYQLLPEQYRNWTDAVGDMGVVYVSAGYSAMGELLNYWSGIESIMYAAVDWPETLHKVVDQINAALLGLIDVLAASPIQYFLMGDNFSSDVQPPHFFETWSKPYYAEAIRRLKAADKFVAVHIDGQLRGSLSMIRDAGADCADAVTPAPMGDLTPQQCREEAGNDFILSGGVPPNLWLPSVEIEEFKASVMRWLELRKISPRLIANAGDQVPPCADEDRIKIMRDLVAEYGRY